jgi:hypothetical protein
MMVAVGSSGLAVFGQATVVVWKTLCRSMGDQFDECVFVGSVQRRGRRLRSSGGRVKAIGLGKWMAVQYSVFVMKGS